MAVERTVNGIDLERLVDTRKALKDNPEAAQVVFRAKNRWDEGTHCCTTVHDFTIAGKEDKSRPKPFVLEAGEPNALLGENEAPNATEALLFALSSCLNTTFILHATAQGVKIDQLEIDLEGNIDLRGFLGIDENVRNGYQDIQVTFKVKSDAPEEKIRELCKMAQERSPVFDIVSNPVPVSAKVELNGVEVHADAPLKFRI